MIRRFNSTAILSGLIARFSSNSRIVAEAGTDLISPLISSFMAARMACIIAAELAANQPEKP
jgi:hypothetical protein